jgi:hypothetical protein
MGKSLIELYPTEFAAREKAWNKVKESSNIELNDVQAILDAEYTVIEAINYGRKDLELELAKNLSSKEGRKVAQNWFVKTKQIISIAIENLQKQKSFGKNTGKINDEIESHNQTLLVLDRILNFLTT